MTSTGTMVGTPYYMSPEQVLSSKAVDFRCDLWALAVVAYTAVTGTLPFVAETLGALCVAISNGTFTAPTELRPDLPPALDAWFERALHRDPERRFGSARELAEAFQRAAGDPRTFTGLTAMRGAATVGVAHTPSPFTAAPSAIEQPSPAPSSKPGGRAALVIGAVGVAALLLGALGTAVVVGTRSKDAPASEPALENAPVVVPAAAATPEPTPKPDVTPAPAPRAEAPAAASAATRAPVAPEPKRAPAATPKRPPSKSTPPAPPKKEADRYGF
jgi:serine/threonine-protein kinase